MYAYDKNTYKCPEINNNFKVILCEPEDWEAIQLEQYISQERNPELKRALEDLDEFLFG